MNDEVGMPLNIYIVIFHIVCAKVYKIFLECVNNFIKTNVKVVNVRLIDKSVFLLLIDD